MFDKILNKFLQNLKPKKSKANLSAAILNNLEIIIMSFIFVFSTEILCIATGDTMSILKLENKEMWWNLWVQCVGFRTKKLQISYYFKIGLFDYI